MDGDPDQTMFALSPGETSARTDFFECILPAWKINDSTMMRQAGGAAFGRGIPEKGIKVNPEKA